jgi:Transposase DNA-binding/Transposase DDE domain
MQLLEELGAADFGDRRLTKRLLKLVESLAPDPSSSFPDAARTDAALEATYRFLGNEEVTPARILAPHVAATAGRVRKAGLAIVAHDTTEMTFASDREGFGPVDGGRGFFAHFALAMDADGSRRPLGVLGLDTFTRGETRRPSSTQRQETDRESYRWKTLAASVEAAVGSRAVIHVMDSEADSFALLRFLVEERMRFVIRLKFDRVVEGGADSPRLAQKLQGLAGRLTREVALSARTSRVAAKKESRRNSSRSSRIATLEFTATPLTLAVPAHLGRGTGLAVHVVHVRERNPPVDGEPVDWKLVTTEPIETSADIERIVDAYRARWTIEEFFKALKTGCAFEKRQLESLPALLNALAVFTPVACQLLRLRSAARSEQLVRAADILSPTQLLVLQRHKDTLLRTHASARDAMRAIARLGGHITNNGEPGWIVLGRGYEKLLTYEQGLLLAFDGKK